MTDTTTGRAGGNGKVKDGVLVAMTPAAPACALGAPTLAGVLKWNGKLCEGWAMLGSEWLDFVNRRLKQDLSLPQQICACRSPAELRDVYAAFWQRVADDYQREFAVMARLGSGFVSNSLTAAQAPFDEAARASRASLSQAA
jgi:hypothetical protein